MKTAPVPSFSSAQLQRAVQAVHSYISGLDEARDKVSADIKSLEAYLADSGLTTEFTYSLGPPKLVPRDREESLAFVSLQDCGSATGWVEEERLLWAEDPSGKFRLVHERCRWDGGVDIDGGGDPYYRDPSTLESERKPLIEAKIGVRMRVHDHLSAFVTELGRHLGAKGVEDPSAFVRDLAWFLGAKGAQEGRDGA